MLNSPIFSGGIKIDMVIYIAIVTRCNKYINLNQR
jgi:hypothetical protein